ncbi:hypothetical protein C1H46_042124 [Malus baccata]|uniref:SREBP regulating gene protein n=1 Tax=Malus baccata TaxID=106549 RepID=A0A540KDN4_MALBA|nr:hypothetical protein C1H46_042124 [Malus baccata]
MEGTTIFSLNVTKLLMINAVLVHALQVQTLRIHYKPRLRPYLTRPPPPPTDGASSSLPSPTRPIPSPPLPSFKGRFRNFNQHICDQSCTLECCDLFGINETLCLNGRLPDHDHPGLPHRPPFIGRILTPYSICYSQCNKRCSYQLPPTLFQCTAGCGYHFIDTKSAELTDLDADKVKKRAASCYHKCRKIFEVV